MDGAEQLNPPGPIAGFLFELTARCVDRLFVWFDCPTGDLQGARADAESELPDEHHLALAGDRNHVHPIRRVNDDALVLAVVERVGDGFLPKPENAEVQRRTALEAPPGPGRRSRSHAQSPGAGAWRLRSSARRAICAEMSPAKIPSSYSKVGWALSSGKSKGLSTSSGLRCGSVSRASLSTLARCCSIIRSRSASTVAKSGLDAARSATSSAVPLTLHLYPVSAARTSCSRNDAGSSALIQGPAIQIPSARPRSGARSAVGVNGPRTRTAAVRGTLGSSASASANDNPPGPNAGITNSLAPAAADARSSSSFATSTGADMCMLARISMKERSCGAWSAPAVNKAASAPISLRR